jgi:hypothetical protein
MEFSRLRDLGLATGSAPEVLEFAAQESRILVSHDVNTMREKAAIRLGAGLSMGGLWAVCFSSASAPKCLRSSIACFSSGPRVKPKGRTRWLLSIIYAL